MPHPARKELHLKTKKAVSTQSQAPSLSSPSRAPSLSSASPGPAAQACPGVPPARPPARPPPLSASTMLFASAGLSPGQTCGLVLIFAVLVQSICVAITFLYFTNELQQVSTEGGPTLGSFAARSIRTRGWLSGKGGEV